METCLAGEDAWRGGDGPLVLERGEADSPLSGAFLEAAQQAGYPRTADVDGERHEGFARFDRNVHRGRRLSAARAYLHPVMDRDHLTVLTRAHAARVVFDDAKHARSVDHLHRRRLQRAHGQEIVLAGGAINTPQLLQLSGIGNADELKEVGVTPIHHLPGVGENLQDHSEAGGFVRTNDEVDRPNLMFHFLPIAIHYDGTSPAGGTATRSTSARCSRTRAGR